MIDEVTTPDQTPSKQERLEGSEPQETGASERQTGNNWDEAKGRGEELVGR